MIESLFHELTPQTVVLTATSRLTRYLQSAIDQHQQKKQRTVWETPRILPLTSWLTQQFHQTNKLNQLLLTDFQEHCLWESIIEQSNLTPALQHPAKLAKLVKSAADTLMQWQLSTEVLTPYAEQIETRCLIEWIHQFRAAITAKNGITPVELPQHLQTIPIEKFRSLPNTLILIGFDDINPSIQSLFDYLEKYIAIKKIALTTKSHVQKIILEDTETELITAATWIKKQWEKNPAARLGCIIPELSAMRAQVERVFTEIFCAEKILPDTTESCMPFNISAGAALSQHKMIHTALSILRWCDQPISIQSLSSLLQSPYLCATEAEACVGAQLDAAIREKNQLHIPMTLLFSVISTQQSRDHGNTYLSRWRALNDFFQEKNAAQYLPSEWANHIVQLLKIIQWPGVRTQSTDEFQALERFKKLLLEFSQLDLLFSAIRFSRAIQLLQSLAQQTIFQPKSHQEPIQIMGVLEASGILFDAVWIMGMHDGIWPPTTKPHPLIPYAIQQRYRMPHATSERELQFCEAITQRMEKSATQILFSSPHKIGDQLLFPSPLIQHIPMITISELALADMNSPTKNIREQLFLNRQLENYTDNQATPLIDFSKIQGGSTILKLQAECPFRAFSIIRLKATPLHEPTIGISALTKGIIIHQLLFEIWQTLGDQQTLLSLDENALQALIAEKIEKTFTEIVSTLRSSENHYFFSIEKKRLQPFIFQWLTLEKTRAAFRIKSLETSADITVEPLPLKIRLDRVDELHDGSLVLIDYKTGENKTGTLLKERLTNPQLPIYAAFQNQSENNYHAVAFAQVRQAEMVFRGLSHEEKPMGDNHYFHITPIHQTKNTLQIDSWEKLITSWRNNVAQLAIDFCRGDATVNPLDHTICERCDLKPICRYQTHAVDKTS